MRETRDSMIFPPLCSILSSHEENEGIAEARKGGGEKRLDSRTRFGLERCVGQSALEAGTAFCQAGRKWLRRSRGNGA